MPRAGCRLSASESKAPGPANTDDGGNVDPLVGKVLSGRFELERLISRGGMGKVYQALQKPLDRVVALKILDVTDGDGEFRRRFFMEASLCARLNHPHTVRIYDYGATDDGIFFIAMEHLTGRTLHDMLHLEAPIDPLRAVIILRRVCGALAEAHAAGIVHRDLKPANIFLVHHGDDPEYPKVIDFGLVKELGKESELSRTGHVLGSPMYMAPEQVEGRHVDARTDVYAVGLMLYYMLCGQTAFPRGNPMAVLMAQVQRTAPTFAEVNPKLQVPGELEWIVRRCIEKGMEDRFASMNELLRALKVVERQLRGELPGPVTMTLVEGQLKVDGVDVSMDTYGSSQIPGSTSLPPPTPLPGALEGPSISTLHGRVEGAPRPEDTSRTQVGLLVAGSALSAFAVGLVGLGLILLAGVGWYTMGGGRQVEAPVAAVAPVARVTVTLTSEPAGAEVERDGKLLGVTPLELALDADSEGFDVTVSKAGHQPRSVHLGPEQTAVHAPLAASTVAPAPAPARGTDSDIMLDRGTAPAPRPKAPAPAPAPAPAEPPAPEAAPAPAPAPTSAPAPAGEIKKW